MTTTHKEPTAQPSVRVQGITKWYPHKTGKLIQGPKEKRPWVKAVDDVSFDIAPGEILGVIGESGCGKSTLGRMLCRLEEPTSGDVLIGGVSTSSMIKKDFRAFRRTVQMIFQNPFDTFTPRDTIGEILMRPLRIHHIGANDEERGRLPLDGNRLRDVVGVDARAVADQGLGIGVLRVTHHVGGRTVLHHAPQVHDRDVVGYVARHGDVVADEHHGVAAVLAHVDEHVDDVGAHRDVEHAHGLVGNDEARVQAHGADDRHALELASRKLMGEPHHDVLGRP